MRVEGDSSSPTRAEHSNYSSNQTIILLYTFLCQSLGFSDCETEYIIQTISFTARREMLLCNKNKNCFQLGDN